MVDEFEIIVIGAGVMGSATAYHLAKDGRQVLLIEQFAVGHNRGASHGHSRIIRLSYDHPVYVKLAREAYRMWTEFEQDAGDKVLFRTGGLDLSEPEHPGLRACISSMQLEEVDYELLDSVEVRRRYPQFQIRPGIVGIFQKDAGILSPDQCVPLLAKMAKRHGAVIVENTPVTKIYFDESGIQVTAGDTTVNSDRLVVTSGPWGQELLKKIGIDVPIKVTQEHYAFLTPKTPDAFTIGRFPIFAQYGYNQNAPDIEFYGFPVFGLPGVKVAEHHFGPVVTADSRSFEVPADALERLHRRTAELIPDGEGEVIHAMTCLYSNTPDHHFVIDALPGYPDIVVGVGFSGHGFKFAIAVGRILADLVTTGRSWFPLDLFALSRFRYASY